MIEMCLQWRRNTKPAPVKNGEREGLDSRDVVVIGWRERKKKEAPKKLK